MQLTIRCHPCAPAATADIEEWLEQTLAHVPEARLLRIIQRLPSGREAVGWLVDVDVDEEAAQTLLRDMRLLGLEPTPLRVVSLEFAGDVR